MTSPAAMRSTRVGGSWRMVMAAIVRRGGVSHNRRDESQMQ
jgi:hypothetical protein